MAANAEKDGADAKKLLSPTTRAKLHAWWEGYAYAHEKKTAPPPPAVDAKHPDPIEPALTGRVLIKEPWPRERIKVAQLIWGDGFTFPGASDFVLELAAPLQLGPDAIALDLGCGLGAGTRALAGATNAWLEGYDLSQELAQAGAVLSRASGMEKRAAIGFLDAIDGSFKPKRYDGVLARNVFSLISDKPKFLQRLVHGMKPGARLVVFDWAIARADAHGEALDAYRIGEATAPRLSTLPQFAGQLEAAGMVVEASDDITDAFAALVLAGWAKIDTLVARGQLDVAEGKALMAEAQLWARRLAALGGGDLRAARFAASKKP
jgi:SAM-dependent methyltransferase